MMKKRILLVALGLSFIASLLLARGVRAKTCTTVWVPDPPPSGSFKMICSGEHEGEEPPGEVCIPGTKAFEVYYLPPEGDLCEIRERLVDVCTGEVFQDVHIAFGLCPEGPFQAENPCEEIIVNEGGFTCSSQWSVEAQVSFPETYLDVRPYPSTLVRWPTASRCGGLPPASSSGTYDYVPYGGGSEGDPRVGDWRDLKLTLTLNAAGPLYLNLPQVGTLALPDVGASGQPLSFRWELPSHPDAGGSVLAGSVAGLESLPPDMPIFVGSAHSPYRLFWKLSYEKYIKECKAGPNSGAGLFECKTKSKLPEDDGHWEYKWDKRSKGGEIAPSMLEELSPNLAADLNGDGVPEAFWNHRVIIRRMDEEGHVDNPQWAASWSWGGTVYWAVREGQGQIGWP